MTPRRSGALHWGGQVSLRKPALVLGESHCGRDLVYQSPTSSVVAGRYLLGELLAVPDIIT